MLFAVMAIGRAQPAPDEFEFPPGRGDAPFGLLLKGVQNIDRRFEPDGVDRLLGIPVVARKDLQDAGAEALEGLGVAVPEAGLGLVERKADAVLHGTGEPLEVRSARTGPLKGSQHRVNRS